MEQRTDEWYEKRLGNITGSRWDEILPGKNGYTASRKNYIADIICERLTGKSKEGFTTKAMQQGIGRESMARFEYEMSTGNTVIECGYFVHPYIEHCGASPDGLVNDDGVLEIKCPEKAQHLQTILTGFIKPEYKTQMQAEIICTQRAWVDFVSYNPDFPSHLQLKIIRILRDKTLIDQMESEAKKTLLEIDEMLLTLKGE